MFCENCGKEINASDGFCMECGAKIPVNENIEDVQDNNTDIQVEDAPDANTASVESNNFEFCSNCGAKLVEGDAFCNVCGTRAGEASKAPNSILDATKKIKFKKSLIIRVAAAILIFATIAAAFPYAKNSLAKLFLSPEKYFAYIINSNFDDKAKVFSDRYSMTKDWYADGFSTKGELNIETGDALTNLVEDAAGYDISEYIDWLDKASIKYNTNSKDNKMALDLGLSINKVDIGSLETVVDMENQEMYYGIPDYQSTPLYVDMNPYDYSYYDDYTDTLQELVEALPSEKITKKLLIKYVECIVKNIDDVEESKDTIEADDITQKVTKLSTDIDGDTILDVSKSVLEELKDDKEVLKIIDDMSSLTNVDEDDFEDIIDEAIDEFDYLDGSDFPFDKITLDLFVDNKGEIAGFEISSEGFNFTSIVSEKGNKFGLLVELFAEGQSIKLEGNGKQFANKRSGEFGLKVFGMSVVDIKAEKVNTKKLKKGLFDGSITIEMSEDAKSIISMEVGSDAASILADLSLTIKSKAKSEKDGNCELILNYEDELCAKLTSKAKVQKGKKVKIPSDAVDTSDYDDLEDWLDELDISKFIDKLEKADVPEEVIEEIEYTYDNAL